MATVVRNRFYAAVALALTGLVLVAFARTYYLREWFTVPPITTLLHLHSIVFTAWFVCSSVLRGSYWRRSSSCSE